MADAGIAIWESKYYYQYWRPVTGIREASDGYGPTGRGDGNRDTVARASKRASSTTLVRLSVAIFTAIWL